MKTERTEETYKEPARWCWCDLSSGHPLWRYVEGDRIIGGGNYHNPKDWPGFRRLYTEEELGVVNRDFEVMDAILKRAATVAEHATKEITSLRAEIEQLKASPNAMPKVEKPESKTSFEDNFLKELKEGSPETRQQREWNRDFINQLIKARRDHDGWLTIMRFGLTSLSNDLPLISELVLREAEEIRGERELHEALTEIMGELKLCFFPLGQN